MFGWSFIKSFVFIVSIEAHDHISAYDPIENMLKQTLFSEISQLMKPPTLYRSDNCMILFKVNIYFAGKTSYIISFFV